MTDTQELEERFRILAENLASASADCGSFKQLAELGTQLLTKAGDQALPYIRRGIELSRQAKAFRVMGRFGIDAAEALMRQGRHEESTEFTNYIKEAADLSGSNHVRGCYYYVMAEAEYAHSRFAGARELFDLARKAWSRDGFIKGEQAVVDMLASIAGLQGKLDEALELYHQSLALAEETGDISSKVSTTFNIGWALEGLGHWEDAIGCFQALLADEQVQSRPGVRADVHNCLGELYLRRDSLGKAIDALRTASVLLEGDQRQDLLCDVLANLGHAYYRQGNYAGAADAYDRGMALAERLGDRREVAVLLWRMAELVLAQGDVAKAQEWCSRSLALAREIETRPVQAEALQVQGLIHVAQGDSGAASESFEQAVTLLADTEEGYELALARLRYGRFLLGRGEAEKAVELLKDAGRAFRKLSVVAEALEVNHLLFAAGLEGRRDDVLLTSLTEMVAMGLEPTRLLEHALQRLCEALAFDAGAVFCGETPVLVHGRPDLKRAAGLGRNAETFSTAEVLSWAVKHGDAVVGHIYLERQAPGPREQNLVLLDAVASLLVHPLERVSQSQDAQLHAPA